jgi:hypothetical protein
MNSHDITLGDFVQQLLLHIGTNKELHFKDERPWHELFYHLKRSPRRAGKPKFLEDMFFDWNGEYPRSRELSSYLHSLHWTGCMAAANPGYDRFKLNAKIGKLWKTARVDSNLRTFIKKTATKAALKLAA